jgi:hypothetical protein
MAKGGFWAVAHYKRDYKDTKMQKSREQRQCINDVFFDEGCLLSASSHVSMAAHFLTLSSFGAPPPKLVTRMPTILMAGGGPSLLEHERGGHCGVGRFRVQFNTASFFASIS